MKTKHFSLGPDKHQQYDDLCGMRSVNSPDVTDETKASAVTCQSCLSMLNAGLLPEARKRNMVGGNLIVDVHRNPTPGALRDIRARLGIDPNAPADDDKFPRY